MGLDRCSQGPDLKLRYVKLVGSPNQTLSDERSELEFTVFLPAC